MNHKEELLKQLSDGVVDMEEEDVAQAAQQFLDAGFPAFDGIMDGLVDGMNRASQLYEEEEYFVTDVLLCSDAMYIGLDILRPYLPETNEKTKIKCAIGVVEGDTHDIGKNLVRIMMETAGFEVIDLGRDVPLQQFIDAVKNDNVNLICMSTLMTTTMGGMETVTNMLKEENLRDKVKILIGGGPISQKFADKIGADGYSVNAVEAVRLAKTMLNVA